MKVFGMSNFLKKIMLCDEFKSFMRAHLLILLFSAYCLGSIWARVDAHALSIELNVIIFSQAAFIAFYFTSTVPCTYTVLTDSF